MPRTLPSAFTTPLASQFVLPVFLFEITLDTAGTIWRVCKNNESITWHGNTYTGYSIRHGGLNEALDGQDPSFDLTISNIDQVAGAYVLQNTSTTTYGLRNKQVRVIMVIMTVNSNNQIIPEATDSTSFVDFFFTISSSEFKSNGKQRDIILKCKAKMFTENALTPGRTIQRAFCWWTYRSRGMCGYTGANIGSPVIYQTGTVSVANGSATVTGSGTSWWGNISGTDVLQTQAMSIQLPASTGNYYTIKSVDSNTSLTLASNYAETTLSGSTYLVRWADWCNHVLDDNLYGCKAHRNTKNFGAFSGVPDNSSIVII